MQKSENKYANIIKLIFWMVLILTPAVPVFSHQVSAQFEFDPGELTPEEKEAFNEIVAPVNKIYNFIKYISIVIASVVLLIAGIIWITSGGDPQRKEQAKNTITYAVLGLVIIVIAPAIVKFVVT